MGPRPFDRGNIISVHHRSFPAALQWGRDHSIAETQPGATRWEYRPGFNGARPSIAETHAHSVKQRTRCFNGAATIRSRKHRGHGNENLDQVALHGAATIRSRNLTTRFSHCRCTSAYSRDHSIAKSPRPTKDFRPGKLQWGRDHSIAEIPLSGT